MKYAPYMFWLYGLITGKVLQIGLAERIVEILMVTGDHLVALSNRMLVFDHELQFGSRPQIRRFEIKGGKSLRH